MPDEEACLNCGWQGIPTESEDIGSGAEWKCPNCGQWQHVADILNGLDPVTPVGEDQGADDGQPAVGTLPQEEIDQLRLEVASLRAEVAELRGGKAVP